MRTVLHLGAAADVLRAELPAASIDMVYADPPFGNRQEWSGMAGRFTDRWTLTPAAVEGWTALAEHDPAGANLAGLTARDENARGYLGVMAGIILQAHRVLKPTGTLWLHFDDTMGAELRVLCDVIFGADNALGVVVWRRSSAHATRRAFGRVHDSIACYGRTRVARWRIARCRGELHCGDPMECVRVGGLLEDQLTATSAERVGYPTQKPVALIKRFILAATLPGDTVLDPTCGSGTTLVAAADLGRNGIGVDLSPDAIAAARKRLDIRAPVQTDLFGAVA